MRSCRGAMLTGNSAKYISTLPCLLMCALFRQKVIAELTDKCKSQEGKMEQVKGFEAERRKYEVDISRY